LLLAAALPLEAAPVTGEADSPLSGQVERVLREEGMAGAVWALMDSDGVVRTGAAGLANTATGERMQPDSRVHVGSIAKTFIATGVLMLASDGRVDLDAPVGRYLPELAFDNPWPGEPVRVRHLLDHTAGLDDMRLWQAFSTQPTADTPLTAVFDRDASVLAIRSRPGRQFSYSNIGYTLAAMVIESVTGERYEDWLGRELLVPLQMRDSTFAFTTQQGPGRDPRLAWGHLDRELPAAALATYLRPAGQFTTTAKDLALFAQFLMGDGRVDGRTLVRPELLRAMGNPGSTDAARAGLPVGYALGLFRRDRHGVVGRCHGGDVVGFHGMLCLLPDRTGAPARQAFVVVENTDCDGRDCGRFDALMVRAMGIVPAAANAAEPASLEVAGWTGRYVPSPNRVDTFRYLDYLFDSPKLAWDGRVLLLSPTQGEPRTLAPAGGLHFVAPDRSVASHVLLRGAQGERLFSDGQRTYRQVGPLKYWGLAASLAAGLLGIAWFALAVPVRALMRREPVFVPGVIAVALLVVPVPLFLLQSYTRLGEATPASIALFSVTAVLPLLMAWQAWRSARRHEGLARGRVNLCAALAVLQWCAVLLAWGLMPLTLWR
jgi:CubicO group peptidase (beta-lactamase class C family)